jgi:site-specific recombinase XerD
VNSSYVFDRPQAGRTWFEGVIRDHLDVGRPDQVMLIFEKGGNEHEMPVHHLLEQILNEYIDAAGLQSGQPLFQSVNSVGTEVTGRALNRYNAWAPIRKRAKAAGFLAPAGCHTWRATGITIYLENDRRLEHAQQMAGDESPRTPKLYDRIKDEITLSEVE